MPDGDKDKVWFRIHKNQMIASVSWIKALGHFSACAGRSKEPCLPNNYVSFDQATTAADAEARAPDGHTCDARCGSWPK